MSEKKLSIIERVVGALSPRWAENRERSRTKAASWQAARRQILHYEGATTGRRSWGWQRVSTDANAVALGARARLRDTARDIVRNNPIGARAVQVIAANIVGRGIIPSAVSSDQGDVDAVEELLKAHFDTADVDSLHRQDLYGLQNLIMRAVITDGEVLVRRRTRLSKDGLALPFTIQVMESDYLDSSIDGQRGGNYVVQGVEFTPFGAVAAYWIFNQHPGGAWFGIRNIESRRVPASEIIHVFNTNRPGEARGVSWFAPVIMVIKDLYDFKDAHLMRQKIASCFAAFVTKDEDFQGDDIAPDQDAESDPYPFETIEPGMIERLKPGEDVKFGNPTNTLDFDPYVKSHARDIAAGFGISYEALTGDLSNVNFSSGRMGWLEFQRTIDGWRDYMLIPQFCWPVGLWFLDAARLVTGRPLVGMKIAWTSPRREMVSPAQEVPAIRNAIRAGLTSRSEEQRKLGFEPADLDREIAADNARADNLELTYDSDPRKTSAAGNAQMAQQDTAQGLGAQNQD